MSFKLHIFTHDQDNVQIPSKVSIIVYNMYLNNLIKSSQDGMMYVEMLICKLENHF